MNALMDPSFTGLRMPLIYNSVPVRRKAACPSCRHRHVSAAARHEYPVRSDTRYALPTNHACNHTNSGRDCTRGTGRSRSGFRFWTTYARVPRNPSSAIRPSPRILLPRPAILRIHLPPHGGAAFSLSGKGLFGSAYMLGWDGCDVVRGEPDGMAELAGSFAGFPAGAAMHLGSVTRSPSVATTIIRTVTCR